MTRAVVFAYHDVGVRCLKTVLARGIDVAYVITHADDPQETIWFGSVAALAQDAGIPVLTPQASELLAVLPLLEQARPDFLFSFYYRFMLPEAFLKLAARGAYNMHGSLLPKYRGRVPVNWAVLHGETETGATLHEMALKPDAGAIIDQTCVPILPDDTAFEVFKKVTVAAEQTLWRTLPHLIAGDAPRRPNQLDQGSYFGGRKPEDGRIDWSAARAQIYNLIRAVAPPYPGAFFDLGGQTVVIEAGRPIELPAHLERGLHVHDNQVLAVCGDGLALLIQRARSNDKVLDAKDFQKLLENQ